MQNNNNTNNRPLILICNDDGIGAQGVDFISHLIFGYFDVDVVVCCPSVPRSGYGSGFTCSEALTIKEFAHETKDERWMKMYSCSGTPIDCVKVAYAKLCPRKPSIIIGGLNHGVNTGINVRYSGTCNIAMEGTIKEVPSVAFSFDSYDDFLHTDCIEKYIITIIDNIFTKGLPKDTFLNVNFPNPSKTKIKGVKSTYQGRSTWINEVDEYQHSRGYKFYWLTGEFVNTDKDNPNIDSNDQKCVDDGYIAITPIKLDTTAYETMDLVNGICKDIEKRCPIIPD